MTDRVDIIEPATERLLLRRWREQDRSPFAALNADPEVMAHFPALLSRAESDAMVDRCQAAMAENGWGLWAVELRGTGSFLGYVGLSVPSFEAAFTPCVEVGWRLARAAWGHGYAVEAARAALDAAYGTLGLDAVVSFTAVDNARSRRVMDRLGMHHEPADDFDHPALPPGHRLRRHVLYRLGRSDRSAGLAGDEYGRARDEPTAQR